MKFNDNLPWMTIVIVIAAIIVMGVGGVAVILNHLDFETYLNDLEKFSVGVGILGVGRGIYKGRGLR
jgi:hypothetical protein